MSEPAKFRLVRCPKCENLLPEIANYSVYQCGGCGAVLRANNRNIEADAATSEKSDEERVLGFSDKIPEKLDTDFDVSKRGMSNLRDGSDNDVRSNCSSTGRAENREIMSDTDTAGDYRYGSKMKADKWVLENEGKRVGARNVGEFEELKPPSEGVNWSRRSRPVSDRKIGDRSEGERFRGNPRMDVEDVRYSTSKHSEQGPSSYQSRSGSGYGEPLKNWSESDRLNKFENLEEDRAELLRKLDELKDQINQSCDLKDKPKGKIPFDRRIVYQDSYSGSETWLPDASMGLNRASMQYPNRHAARPPYIGNHPEPSPYMSRRNEMASHNAPRRASNQFQGFADPIGYEMLTRNPHQGPGPFQQQPPRAYFSGHYLGDNMYPHETYSHDRNLHPPSCSCIHCCYSQHRQVPAPVPPTAFGNNMFPNVPNDPMFFRHEKPDSFGPPQDYNPRTVTHPPLSSHNLQSYPRWPGDLNSEVGGFAHRGLPPREVLPAGGRLCRPIAGGAPFVTCYNCFELLRLPKKFLHMEKNQKKVQCGGCSTVILFAIVNKKLVSTNAEIQESPMEAVDIPSVVMNGGTSHSHGNVNPSRTSFSSDDYDNSGCDFQAMDREPASFSEGNDSGSGKPVEMISLHSTSAGDSGDEDSPESLNASREVINITELPMQANSSLPHVGSPLQEHSDCPAKSRAVDRLGKGNQSGRSDQEKVMPKKITSRKNSMKDTSLATEMELSANEYAHTVESHDLGDASLEEDRLKANKGAESFFAAIIKKSFRDKSRSNQSVDHCKTNVTVNGHPIPDRLVKKAEKIAGPVHPGEYWYDFRGGFWGVMGGPCLGIVPPFIEEFNFPMPENCAGGSTGVFVNGRELHQKDLDLLGSRGLPTARDGSYIVEISGRVLDENSGEEIDSLGKLAPTVERVKRGFGMKVPRAHLQE